MNVTGKYKVGDIIRINKSKDECKWYTYEDMVVVNISGSILKAKVETDDNVTYNLHYSRVHLSGRLKKLEKLNEICRRTL